MATLLFFDQGHKYTVDGQELPSVSELCRFLSREIYGDINQYTLDAAADRGTRVHKATEALDLYGKVDVDDDILPYLQAYLNFRKEHQVTWEKIEYAAYHPEDGYAGTIDRYGLLDGKRAIVDYKTTAVIHKPLCAATLNLYRRTMVRNGFQVDALFILQLKKDGKYRMVEFPVDDELPSALLTLHHTLEKKGRKPKCKTN